MDKRLSVNSLHFRNAGVSKTSRRDQRNHFSFWCPRNSFHVPPLADAGRWSPSPLNGEKVAGRPLRGEGKTLRTSAKFLTIAGAHSLGQLAFITAARRIKTILAPGS